MRIFGFNDNRAAACEDTRFLSDKELIAKIEKEDRILQGYIKERYKEMKALAKLSNNYMYLDNVRTLVGTCFMEIDGLKQRRVELKNKLSKLKEGKQDV